MTLKKYTISLDGLLSHESIIFKLICSVSERTKNRSNTYALTTDENNSNIKINDIKNKSTDDTKTENHLNVWVTDKADDSENTIARPLIATRVLHTLDKLIENIKSDEKEQTVNEDAVQDDAPSSGNSVDFNISEEEASELAIVHDEVLENPANKEALSEANNIELTLVKNEAVSSPLVQTGTPHILVVDDSQSVRKQLELELELFDVTVDFADTAEAAFNLLKSNTYHLALLDVVLPDKDGFQICKYIKNSSKETIAIMLTGKASQSDKIKGSLAGCDDYLIKPVGRITFQNAVKNFIQLKNTHTAIEA